MITFLITTIIVINITILWHAWFLVDARLYPEKVNLWAIKAKRLGSTVLYSVLVEVMKSCEL